MFTSFSTALSALNAHSIAVDVVGNNLANLNTTGYKASVTSFRDMVTQSLGAGLGETQVGFGTGRPLTVRQFSQGAIQMSTSAMDAALQGDGFFLVRDSSNQLLYTRAGNFQVDMNGNMLTATGEKVQGWTQTDAAGNVDPNSAIGAIAVSLGQLKAPRATNNVSVDVNLNATAAIGDTFSTPIEVVDSLGAKHVLAFTFTKKTSTPTGTTWDVTAALPAADYSVSPAPAPVAVATLSFDVNGKMTAPAKPDPNASPAVPPTTFDIPSLASGATMGTVKAGVAGTLTIDLYNGIVPRITQYTQPSAVSSNSQDGMGPASLIRVGIADGGKVLAQYSDGQQKVIALLAIASVRNPESLVAAGDNNYKPSTKTAQAVVGLPETGGRGKVIGSSLESSTVDMGREFTNLIVFQRGYQANAKIVSVVDELSQETINLKR